MIKISTERLQVMPLSARQLSLALDDFQALEKELCLEVTDTELDEGLQYATQVRRRKVLEDEDNFMWLTNWMIISKETNNYVGIAMIKGVPNESGEVIIGYGIEEKHRCKGYASEAVGGLISWIFEDSKAKYIFADTDLDNIASHKVLINNGAQRFRETDELIWWMINKS